MGRGKGGEVWWLQLHPSAALEHLCRSLSSSCGLAELGCPLLPMPAHPAEASTSCGATATELPHTAGVPLCSGAPKYLGHPVLWGQLWCPWTSGCLGVLPEQDPEQHWIGHGLSCSLQSTCTSPAWLELTGGSWGCLALDPHTQSTHTRCFPLQWPWVPWHPLEKSQGRSNPGKEAQTGAGAFPAPGWRHPGTGTDRGWVLGLCLPLAKDNQALAQWVGSGVVLAALGLCSPKP